MPWPKKRGKIWHGIWWEGSGKERKQRSRSLKVSGPKIPLNKLHELEQELEAKKEGTKKDITWDLFQKLYLEWAETNKVAESVARDRITLRYFDKLVPVHLLKHIQPFHLERYKIERKKMASQRYDGHAHIKESTINREINTLKSMVRRATEWGNLDKNPWLLVQKFEEDQSTPETFCGKEDILEKRCKSARRKIILNLVIRQGMRRGEMANIRIEDFDFEAKTIKVVSTMGRRTKTKRERILPLHAKTNEAVLAYIGKRKEGFLLGDGEHKQDADMLGREFLEILQEAGVKGTLHKGRHTFGTNLARRGVDTKTIMDLLGHSRITTTEIYLQTDREHKRRAIDTLT